MILKVTWRAEERISDFNVAIQAHRSTDGLPLYEGAWTSEELGCPHVDKGQTFAATFSFRAHLTRGHYHLASQVMHNPTQVILGRVRPAAIFAVEEWRTTWGVADLAVSATIGPAQGPVALPSVGEAGRIGDLRASVCVEE